MHHVPNARSELVAGLRAVAPLTMAIVPLGMVCGASAVAAGLTAWQAFALGWLIFAGSAQIVVVQLLAGGAPLAVIVATATVVNLRFMMYSASLGPHLGVLGKCWRMLLAYLITDQAYVLGVMRYMEPGEKRHRHWFYLGIAGATWISWQLSNGLGIVLGSVLPQNWSLDFILPLTFISILVPMLSNRAVLFAALVGGAASVLLILPLKLNLIAAVIVGVMAGLAAERLAWSK